MKINIEFKEKQNIGVGDLVKYRTCTDSLCRIVVKLYDDTYTLIDAGTCVQVVKSYNTLEDLIRIERLELLVKAKDLVLKREYE